eukprot:s1934_g14.t1
MAQFAAPDCFDLWSRILPSGWQSPRLLSPKTRQISLKEASFGRGTLTSSQHGLQLRLPGPAGRPCWCRSNLPEGGSHRKWNASEGGAAVHPLCPRNFRWRVSLASNHRDVSRPTSSLLALPPVDFRTRIEL